MFDFFQLKQELGYDSRFSAGPPTLHKPVKAVKAINHPSFRLIFPPSLRLCRLFGVLYVYHE